MSNADQLTIDCSDNDVIPTSFSNKGSEASPIRVAQVADRTNDGGAEATVMNYYRHIDRSQAQFDFFTHTDSTAAPEKEIKSLGGRVLCVSSYRNPDKYVNGCRKLSKQTNPSVAHSRTNEVSDSDPVHIGRNAIDINRFTFIPESRSRKRNEPGIDDAQLFIGQVGRIRFQKNQTFTVNVFPKPLKKRSDTVPVFIGNGNNSGVHTQLHNLGIERNIGIIGIRNDVADFYSAFDALMLPSMHEGLGMASIEAQTTDLPVTCSSAIPKESDLIPELVQRIPHNTDVDSWVSILDEYENNAFSRLSHKKK